MENIKAQADKMNEYLNYLWLVHARLWCVEGVTVEECIATNVSYMKVIRQQENFFPFLKNVHIEYAKSPIYRDALIERKNKMVRLGELNSPTGCGSGYWNQWTVINDALSCAVNNRASSPH